MTAEECLSRLAIRAIGFQGDEQEFIAIFNSIFQFESADGTDAFCSLKRRFPLYLLSNTSELHLAYLHTKL